MSTLVLGAPAKLNLGLRIVGVREDGNHELESVFAPLELEDRLELEVEPSRVPEVYLELECDDPDVPAGSQNLAARAATAFLEAGQLSLRVGIGLAKSIPSGAGLGGGSSDAGAVLRGMTKLYPAAVPDLEGLALRLGADVPYFLDPRPAFVTGIGERCEPLPGLSALWLVLLLPREKLATAAVYRVWDALCDGLTPRSAASTMPLPSRLRTDPEGLTARMWTEALRNDLEPAAVRLCPAIARLRRRMHEAGATAVGMSGSGPAVFGLFQSGAEAQAAEARLAQGGPVRIFRTRTLGSP